MRRWIFEFWLSINLFGRFLKTNSWHISPLIILSNVGNFLLAFLLLWPRKKVTSMWPLKVALFIKGHHRFTFNRINREEKVLREKFLLSQEFLVFFVCAVLIQFTTLDSLTWILLDVKVHGHHKEARGMWKKVGNNESKEISSLLVFVIQFFMYACKKETI